MKYRRFLGNEALSWLQIIVGLFISACAYRMYLIPNEIAPGGFTGIGQLVNSFTGWPVGLISLLMNVPLFALSMRSMGLRFGIKSALASVAFSLAVDRLYFLGPVTSDPMLAAVFGGVLGGIGMGLILRGGATTGGSDMLGSLLNNKVPVFKISHITLGVDALVVVASGFVFDPTSAMFALISVYLFSQLLDLVMEGPNLAKAYFIISDQSDLIAQRIMETMNRGVTCLHGTGMYSQKDKRVLLCVINRLETVQLRNILAATDKDAFVIATNVHEALGEGFKPHVRI